MRRIDAGVDDGHGDAASGEPVAVVRLRQTEDLEGRLLDIAAADLRAVVVDRIVLSRSAGGAPLPAVPSV